MVCQNCIALLLGGIPGSFDLSSIGAKAAAARARGALDPRHRDFLLRKLGPKQTFALGRERWMPQLVGCLYIAHAHNPQSQGDLSANAITSNAGRHPGQAGYVYVDGRAVPPGRCGRVSYHGEWSGGNFHGAMYWSQIHLLLLRWTKRSSGRWVFQ